MSGNSELGRFCVLANIGAPSLACHLLSTIRQFMITDYEIITARRVADLQDRVRERIRDGWQPAGGIAAVHEEDAGRSEPHLVFAQALVSERGSRSQNG